MLCSSCAVFSVRRASAVCARFLFKRVRGSVETFTMSERQCIQCRYQRLLNESCGFMKGCRDAVKICFSSENRPGLLHKAAASRSCVRLRVLLQAFPWSDEELAHALYAVRSPRAARAIARSHPRVFQDSAPQAVMNAVMSEDVATLRALLQAGAPADRPCGSWDDTPLHMAIACRKWDCALELLLCGVDPNPRDSRGDTPLHRAATHGRVAVLWLLVNLGRASVAARCLRKQTPLHRAAAHANENCAAVLVSNGANVAARDCEGVAPLHLAAAASLAITRALLRRGVDPETSDYRGKRPVHYAASSGNCETIRLLAEDHSVDIHARTREGSSPMHFAAAGCSAACVRELALLGADVNTCDRRGMTPLHVAAALGRVDVLRELLRLGARTDLRAHNDVTPLMIAVTRRNEQCGRTLIEAGADVDAGTAKGYLSLQGLRKNLPDTETEDEIQC